MLHKITAVTKLLVEKGVSIFIINKMNDAPCSLCQRIIEEDEYQNKDSSLKILDLFNEQSFEKNRINKESRNIKGKDLDYDTNIVIETSCNFSDSVSNSEYTEKVLCEGDIIDWH